MSAEDVGKAFVAHVYQARYTNPDGLAGLYTPQSMLTYEGTQVMGVQDIISKLKTAGQCQYDVKTMDVQPSPAPNALCLFVTGVIKIGGQSNPLHFCEFFQLIQNAPGSYHVHNDVFRLNYGL